MQQIPHNLKIVHAATKWNQYHYLYVNGLAYAVVYAMAET